MEGAQFVQQDSVRIYRRASRQTSVLGMNVEEGEGVGASFERVALSQFRKPLSALVRC